MNFYNVTSDYGHLHFRQFYIGWNNYDSNSNDGLYIEDGDENFGLAIGRLYVGCYSKTGWCAGVLDENGCLPD